MRNTYKQGRRTSGLTMLALGIGTIAIGGVGAIGTLWAMGEIDLPFLRRGPQIPPGSIAVPVSGHNINAYTKLNRDHITDPTTGQLKFIYVAPGFVTPDMITDFNKIFGRVLDHDKPAGYAFTERDFMPKGTRPGLVAGIPAGKRSLTLEANKLAGVFGLKVGDHIDLVATVPFDSKYAGRGTGASGALATQHQMAAMQKRARVRVLAQDAVIVSPVTSRSKPIQSSSLTNGAQVRTVPVQEIVIAVAPTEVAPISEAVATQVDISCVARSGLPDDLGPNDKTPGADPLADMNVVDSLHGNKRDSLVFSNGGARMRLVADETATEPLSDAVNALPAASGATRPRPKTTFLAE